jgi:hypothetical protein
MSACLRLLVRRLAPLAAATVAFAPLSPAAAAAKPSRELVAPRRAGEQRCRLAIAGRAAEERAARSLHAKHSEPACSTGRSRVPARAHRTRRRAAGGRAKVSPIGPASSIFAPPPTVAPFALPAGEPSSTAPPGGSEAGSGALGEAGGEPEAGAASATGWYLESDPIDPKFLTETPFGTSSFWLQPWRAYMDTWPASRLTESLGINFNVGPAQAEYVAQLLQDSGFKLARREIGWGALSYEDPSKFLNESRIRAVLLAMHNHGLRPLILLNANSGDPAPSKKVTLETTAAAAAGAQSVRLSPASAEQVVPGKTGFNGLSFGGSPDILITSVGAGDVATLSRPLAAVLAAGTHKGTTLRYAPFEPPTFANGQPNPVFRETLTGWLKYVATVCREVEGIFGPGGYDLEVWNELGFGSQFLDWRKYYSPVTGWESVAQAESAREQSIEVSSIHEGAGGVYDPEGSSSSDAGSEAASSSEAPTGPEGTPDPESSKESAKRILKSLLGETVAFVRDRSNGFSPGVGITDGFASQTPFPSGALAPIGLTALSKHLYNGPRTFPAEFLARSIRPIDAQGNRDSAKGSFTPFFIPAYRSYFPEFALSATSTETIVRDIAPFTTDIYGFPHGRNIGPEGGAPLQKWMTEYNLGTGKNTPVGPDGVTPENVALTPTDREHFQAKALLRSLVAMIGKGMTREYFFAAAQGGLSLISNSFFSALQANPNTYPGDQTGGQTMDAFRNLLADFQGPGPEGQTRQLRLLSIAQEGGHAQFKGDGTAAHPNLYDRDVLAVLPFQASPTHFLIPVYVMTRDLLTLYQPNAPQTDATRYDLPNEKFKITLANLPETPQPPTITSYDPLRNTQTPTRLLERQGNTATIEITTTDYPRVLSIEY